MYLHSVVRSGSSRRDPRAVNKACTMRQDTTAPATRHWRRLISDSLTSMIPWSAGAKRTDTGSLSTIRIVKLTFQHAECLQTIRSQRTCSMTHPFNSACVGLLAREPSSPWGTWPISHRRRHRRLSVHRLQAHTAYGFYLCKSHCAFNSLSLTSSWLSYSHVHADACLAQNMAT